MSNEKEKIINWAEIYETPIFKTVFKRRLSFVVPAIIIFFVLFFVLFTIQNYYPNIAHARISGYYNVAFSFTMLLFPTFWLAGYAFTRYTTKHVHPLEDEIVETYSLKEDNI